MSNRLRSADTGFARATQKPDPVTSSVNSAADSTSNHRIVLTQLPIDQSRRNAADESSVRSPLLDRTALTTKGISPSSGQAES